MPTGYPLVLDKDEVIRLRIEERKLVREIAVIMKCSPIVISRRLESWGYGGNLPTEVDDLEDILPKTTVLRLLETMTAKDIAKLYDVYYDAVKQLTKRYGIKLVRAKGFRNSRWKGGITHTDTTCEQCGKPFSAFTPNMRVGWGRFCSRSCGAINRMKSDEKKRWTIPEKLVWKYLLAKYGLMFYPQYVINGYGVADFYNPWFRMIVEVQGDYWHSLPKMRERDRRKRQFASDGCYQLVELWESDIKERFQIKR